MSQIYLEHPVHGRKIASMELEAEFDEKHGWIRSESIERTNVQEQPPVNALEAKRKYTRRAVTEGV
jgi:hypothetical protein